MHESWLDREPGWFKIRQSQTTGIGDSRDISDQTASQHELDDGAPGGRDQRRRD